MKCTESLAAFFGIFVIAMFAAAIAEAQPVFVPIAPCRVLDTTTKAPATAEEETSRKVDVRTTRCSRVIPPYASAYSVVITTVGRDLPDDVPPGAMPVREASRMIPVPAAGAGLHFPVPPNRHVAVDIDGYYLAPGVPLLGLDETLRSAERPATPAANAVHEGSAGEIYLDGSVAGYAQHGVVMSAAAATPSILAKTGTATAASAFTIVNSSGQQLLTTRGDGSVKLPSSHATSFFDGATDFFGSPGTYPGYVAIPMNTIHNVTLLSPRDAANSNVSRLYFFNAESSDEYGSPPITKYRAFTLGFYGQQNINFDSVVHYHKPSQYYYRAHSSYDGKDTFSVRARHVNNSSRADLYLHGKMHVEDLASDVDMTLSAGDEPGAPNFPTFTLMRKDGNDVQAAKYGLRLDSDDGNKFKLLYGTTAGFTRDILVVDPAGAMTIGTENAKVSLRVEGSITASTVVGATFRDLAEWVPAVEDLAPGTVVILDTGAADTVRASNTAYDTTVAGVVASQPGLLLGEAADSREMIATTGRVRVKVDATRAPVKIGDLLVTGDKPGTAMKSQPVDVGGIPMHRPGTILGKALEPLAGGEGEILVLLSLQ